MPVVPVSRRHIYLTTGGTRPDDRGDQQVSSQQVLIINVTDRGVVLMVKNERTLYRRSRLRGFQEAGIQVRQQAVAQLDRGSHVILNDLTEGPRVLINIANLGVVATEGS